MSAPRGKTRRRDDWRTRLESAFRRVMPADGSWHPIRATVHVHTGDGRVRLILTCRGQREFVELTATEMDEALTSLSEAAL